MDRLDELAVFVAIIDSGSMAAAARKLRRSAPQVTRALSELENRAGARLVERTTRRLSPTEAGHAMAQKARALLADYDHMLSGVSEAPLRGLLRVTAPVQFGRRHVAPVVSSFLDAFPRNAGRADPPRPQSRPVGGRAGCCGAHRPAVGFDVAGAPGR